MHNRAKHMRYRKINMHITASDTFTAQRLMKKNLFTKYGFFWVTLILFLTSAAGHWTFAWFAYVKEQEAHLQPVETKELRY
jgi:hypothetical protein